MKTTLGIKCYIVNWGASTQHSKLHENAVGPKAYINLSRQQIKMNEWQAEAATQLRLLPMDVLFSTVFGPVRYRAPVSYTHLEQYDSQLQVIFFPAIYCKPKPQNQVGFFNHLRPFSKHSNSLNFFSNETMILFRLPSIFTVYITNLNTAHTKKRKWIVCKFEML